MGEKTRCWTVFDWSTNPQRNLRRIVMRPVLKPHHFLIPDKHIIAFKITPILSWRRIWRWSRWPATKIGKKFYLFDWIIARVMRTKVPNYMITRQGQYLLSHMHELQRANSLAVKFCIRLMYHFAGGSIKCIHSVSSHSVSKLGINVVSPITI